MDERAKQFKEAAETKLTGGALVKEIASLRRFLFRNQEHRFAKSAQNSLYMAILAHHANSGALVPASSGEPPVLQLLDDALKMPFTVFTSSQKDKLLQLYWSVLGEVGGEGRDTTAAAASAKRYRDLTLLDIVDEGTDCSVLSLIHDNGTEYTGRVVVTDAGVIGKMRGALESCGSVVVTLVESAEGAAAEFVSFTAKDE